MAPERKSPLMRILNRRAITGALITGAAVLLTVGALAGPADAAGLRRPAPLPTPVATSAPAPAPSSTPAAAPTELSGTVTHLGANFSAGGYTLVSYAVKTTAAGVYTVRYTTDVAGSAVNTTIDGVSLKQVVVGTAAPVTTSTFTLAPGVHSIGTQSPDGYGSTSIDLVRVG